MAPCLSQTNLCLLMPCIPIPTMNIMHYTLNQCIYKSLLLSLSFYMLQVWRCDWMGDADMARRCSERGKDVSECGPRVASHSSMNDMVHTPVCLPHADLCSDGTLSPVRSCETFLGVVNMKLFRCLCVPSGALNTILSYPRGIYVTYHTTNSVYRMLIMLMTLNTSTFKALGYMHNTPITSAGNRAKVFVCVKIYVSTNSSPRTRESTYVQFELTTCRLSNVKQTCRDKYRWLTCISLMYQRVFITSDIPQYTTSEFTGAQKYYKVVIVRFNCKIVNKWLCNSRWSRQNMGMNNEIKFVNFNLHPVCCFSILYFQCRQVLEYTNHSSKAISGKTDTTRNVAYVNTHGKTSLLLRFIVPLFAYPLHDKSSYMESRKTSPPTDNRLCDALRVSGSGVSSDFCGETVMLRICVQSVFLQYKKWNVKS